MQLMREIMAVAAGGAFGAVARFLTTQWVHGLVGRGFPWGTLAVNVLGSLLLGTLYALMLERFATSPELRAALLVGVLGAFTTFSTFAVDTVGLLEQGEFIAALANILAQVVICLLAAWLGLTVARALF